MTNAQPITNITLSFEEALTELEEILHQIEEGDIGLDEAIAQYARANLLQKHCEAKLQQARLKVAQIAQNKDSVALEEYTQAN